MPEVTHICCPSEGSNVPDAQLWAGLPEIWWINSRANLAKLSPGLQRLPSEEKVRDTWRRRNWITKLDVWCCLFLSSSPTWWCGVRYPSTRQTICVELLPLKPSQLTRVIRLWPMKLYWPTAGIPISPHGPKAHRALPANPAAAARWKPTTDRPLRSPCAAQAQTSALLPLLAVAIVSNKKQCMQHAPPPKKK